MGWAFTMALLHPFILFKGFSGHWNGSSGNVLVALIKHQDQKQLGQERLKLILSHLSPPQRKVGQVLRAGAWRQEQKQRPQRAAASWLALFSSWLAPPAFPYKQDHLPGVAALQWAGPSHRGH